MTSTQRQNGDTLASVWFLNIIWHLFSVFLDWNLIDLEITSKLPLYKQFSSLWPFLYLFFYALCSGRFLLSSTVLTGAPTETIQRSGNFLRLFFGIMKEHCSWRDCSPFFICYRVDWSSKQTTPHSNTQKLSQQHFQYVRRSPYAYTSLDVRDTFQVFTYHKV
jgi:hypothetical protein